MKKKRVLCLLLALSIYCSLMVPALAADGDETAQSADWEATYPRVESSSSVTAAPGADEIADDELKVDPAAVNTITTAADGYSTGMTTTLTGTIKATQLKVTVPAAVFFILDPTKQKGDDPTDQVIQPDFQIINSSLVPIYARVKKVTVTGAHLVDKTERLKSTKTLMFGFKSKGSITTLTQPSDWLNDRKDNNSTGGNNVDSNGDLTGTYLLTTDRGRIEALKYDSAQAKEVPGTLDMQIYARAYIGWEAQETFTVTPTIVVSVVPFTATSSANLEEDMTVPEDESPIPEEETTTPEIGE